VHDSLDPVKPSDISSDFDGDEAYLEVKVEKATHTYVLTKKDLADLIEDLKDTLSLM
jgi:hypothetical protein